MITQEPVRGSFAYLEEPWLFALPGFDQLRLFIDGRLPSPPIHHLSGLKPVEASPGASVWSMPASPWWQTAAGVFAGGALAFATDTALGSAIYSTLPPKTGLITSELSMNFLQPATPGSVDIVSRGTLVHAGRRQGLSEARIEDASGLLLAHATSRCVIQPLPFDPPERPASIPPVSLAEHEDPDPYLRPPEGAVLSNDVWNETAGLDLVERWRLGELPMPPSCRLAGWTLTEAAEGTATCVMPASPWFCTGFGAFYGGAIAMLADGAMTTAVTTTIPAGTSFGTLDLKVNFLRPVTPDGRDLTARASVVQRGRTIAVTTAEIDDATGKRVAMAVGSAMILPGRSWDTEPNDPSD
jgi:uncharacterized protein (TIGR00369 family)